LKNIIDEFSVLLSRLPGIGKKGAIKIAYYILEYKDKTYLSKLEKAINNLNNIAHCKECFNYTHKGKELCDICLDDNRDKKILCIVENAKDLNYFSNSNYKGLYHSLNGLISPINGIDANNLNIDFLIKRIKNLQIKELIFALPLSSEGEITSSYIKDQIEENNCHSILKISKLAMGIPMGGDLSQLDYFTINQSIEKRIDY